LFYRIAYWTQAGYPGGVLRDTYTADKEETLVDGLSKPRSIALDLPNELMYIAMYAGSDIYIYQLNGTTVGILEAKTNICFLTMMGKITI